MVQSAAQNNIQKSEAADTSPLAYGHQPCVIEVENDRPISENMLQLYNAFESTDPRERSRDGTS